MEERQGFAFYRDFYDTYCQMIKDKGQEKAYKYLVAVIEMGLNGDYDKSDPDVNIVMVQTRGNINRARASHQKDTAFGKKGGRPAKFPPEETWRLLDEGYSVKEIAQIRGCSEKTVVRHRNIRPANGQNGQNPI